MAFLLDNITSTMISMSVLVMMVVMQHRAQEATAQRTMSYAAKVQTIELGEWIQEDLLNVGAGYGGGSTAIAYRNENAAGQTATFRFYRKMDSADATAATVEYTLTPTTVSTIGGEEVQMYQVQRRVDGVLDGKSNETLTAFHIEMLDATGAETDLESAVRQLRLRFSLALPFPGERNRFVHEMHWSTNIPLRDTD